ncbi:MAG: hypothetical protein ARM1_0180 [Candidatus Micrarchaeota archaeon]|nr:MAG: hypothetical protein ARM1_0180 [Candidatus Micrarchaeota archaeon]
MNSSIIAAIAIVIVIIAAIAVYALSSKPSSTTSSVYTTVSNNSSSMPTSTTVQPQNTTNQSIGLGPFMNSPFYKYAILLNNNTSTNSSVVLSDLKFNISNIGDGLMRYNITLETTAYGPQSITIVVNSSESVYYSDLVPADDINNADYNPTDDYVVIVNSNGDIVNLYKL